MEKMKSRLARHDSGDQKSAVELLRANVTAFPSIAEAGDALAKCFDSFGSSPATKVILIGDASHGTSEFYAARAEITKYMIENHGFNIVAVEADWPDAEAVDRYVRHRRPGPGEGPGPVPDPEAPRGNEDTATGGAQQKEKGKEKSGKKKDREPAFTRFPTWMWRNNEVHEFVEWLRAHNRGTDPHEAVGFYGLDLYSMGASMRAVIDYLDEVDPSMAAAARERYGRLMMWAEEPQEYGLESLGAGFRGCEREVVAMLRDLLSRRLEYASASWDGIEFHSGEQNARLVRDAEYYYKAMFYARDESWNLRDTHMFQTLARLLKHRGGSSRAVVWAHNSHVGDARATSMGWARAELNLGQLCRESLGRPAALAIGCWGYAGSVAAADRWDGDMRVMPVRPGLPGSYEELMHATGVPNFALDLRDGSCDDRLRRALCERRLERFIGVIYRPETERQSHYSAAVLPEQFDGLVWFDETRAVAALEAHQPHPAPEFEETWPFGL